MKKLKIFYKSIIWTIIIIILSNISGDSVDNVNINIPFMDKIVHSGLYFILSFLLTWDLNKLDIYKFSKNAIITIIYSTSVGLFMEITQKYLAQNRSFDIFDELFNIIGVLSGILFFYKFENKFK